MNKIIEARKKRANLFLNLDPSVARMFHIHIRADSVSNPMPPLWRENIGKRIDCAARAYETSMKRIEWLDDDFIPYLSCGTGTEIFAEAFGCEVSYPPNSNPFALPFITDAAEVSALRVPNLHDSTLSVLYRLADELKRKCGNDALLGLPDVQTPMDISALIWDKNYFFPAMLNEPEAVSELAKKVSALYFAFFDEWFERYGPEFIAHYPDYYMPSGLTYSEDEVGSVSPETFNELFLPELIGISERYGQVGMHCCANAKHQWPNFIKIPNLKILNLVQPNETLIKSSAYFAGRAAQFPNFFGEGPEETWFSQLNEDAHTMLDFTVDDEEAAKRLADKLRQILRQ